MTLKQARIGAEMTQQDVAKAMGIDTGTYAKYEKNPETMTLKRFRDFCRVVNVSSDAIFFEI